MTAGSDQQTFVFDPWDVSWRDDRTEQTVDLLVEHHPVYPLADGRFVISRYSDVREILGDHDRFTAKPNQGELIGFPPRIDGDQDPVELQRLGELMGSIPFDVSEFAGADVIVGVDPPRHTRIRGIVARGFVPRRIRALESEIDTIVASTIAGLSDADEFDLHSGLAVPVPIRVIGGILGLGPERDADLKRWSDVLSASVHGPDRGTAGAAADLIEMLIEFARTFLPLVEARRADPGDDLISDMVRAEEVDTLTAVEAVLFLIILMAAANETTTSLIGNAATYLLAHPDQLRRLLDDPSLVDGVVEETLRLCCPVQFVYRAPNEDIELHGVHIPAGSPLVLMLTAASRDPRQYPDPHHFDITRRGGSLAFGFGAHTCLGAHLGRIEGRKTLSALTPLLPSFTVDKGSLRLDRSAFTRAWTAIPLTRITCEERP